MGSIIVFRIKLNQTRLNTDTINTNYTRKNTMRRIIMGILMMFVMQSSLYAGTVPTQENVTKLYVATFNRAPDAGGLAYWVTTSRLNLEGIAQSFFDQPETQEVYPPDSTNADFIEAVYINLFNRAPDQAGLNYWVRELDSGRIAKSVFILAVINGAQNTEEFGNDAMILANKTTVGLAFSNAGLNDTMDAKEIMLEVTDDKSTVTEALDSYEISPPNHLEETKLSDIFQHYGSSLAMAMSHIFLKEHTDIKTIYLSSRKGTFEIRGSESTLSGKYTSPNTNTITEGNVLLTLSQRDIMTGKDKVIYTITYLGAYQTKNIFIKVHHSFNKETYISVMNPTIGGFNDLIKEANDTYGSFEEMYNALFK